MRSSGLVQYAFRMSFGQGSNQVSSQSWNNAFSTVGSPDRVITRSATVLAVFGIALSSFSLKQMLNSNGNNKPSGALSKF